MKRIKLAAAFAFLGAVQAFAQTSGAVGGTVLDEKGKPYTNGVRVVIVKAPERPEGFVPFVTNAVTGKDGKYALSGIPAGKYEICLTAPGTDYVDVCQWGRPAATIFITAAASAVNKDLQLEKGKFLTIDVKDDGGYIDRHLGKSTGGVMSIGVVTEKRDFVVAELQNASKVNRKYRVAIPDGAKFRIRAIAPLFDIRTDTDQKQSLLVLQDIDLTIEPTENAKSVGLRVEGLKTLEIGK